MHLSTLLLPASLLFASSAAATESTGPVRAVLHGVTENAAVNTTAGEFLVEFRDNYTHPIFYASLTTLNITDYKIPAVYRDYPVRLFYGVAIALAEKNDAKKIAGIDGVQTVYVARRESSNFYTTGFFLWGGLFGEKVKA